MSQDNHHVTFNNNICGMGTKLEETIMPIIAIKNSWEKEN